MNAVPTTDAGWSTAPFEPQYLKLIDVVPPPAPTALIAPKAYVIGTQATVSWTPVTDPEGGISGYSIEVDGAVPNGAKTFSAGATSGTLTFNAGPEVEDGVVSITVRAVNGAGVPSAASQSVLIRRLSSTGDLDRDGQSNAAEDLAGTDPLLPASVFRVLTLKRRGSDSVEISWSSVPGRDYQVLAAENPSDSYTPRGGLIRATAETAAFQDTLSGTAPRFYKVQVLPP